ncbi:MAG: glycerol-3-phosphate 1-O-acyltransferase PlsY [Cyanobacteria bacterium REEB65]|nr:glycerol-3-phosphate 1-O-acyltransferase PlsY [Cyanobacteria bacterium REEB65]
MGNSLVMAAFIAVGSYVLGAVPFSFLVPKLFYGVDIRQVGSGNVGATNVVRAVGRKAGISCFVLDAAKGALPVAVAQIVPGAPAWLAIVAAAGAIMGHSLSIFLRGKGGKAVATGVGTVLAMSPFVGLAALALWLLVFQVSRVVSIASITAALVLPGLMAALPRPGMQPNPPVFVYFAMAAGFYVIARHRENIRRIAMGTEPRFGQRPRDNQ